MPTKINLLSVQNGAGLEKDQAILMHHLRELGVDVTENSVKEKPLYFAKTQQSFFDINLFCQDIEPIWFKAAKKNFLIPNQELVRHSARLDQFDIFLCKTQYALQIFKERSLFLGFTSEDHWMEYKKEPIFLHMAGKSPFKGTTAVLDAWRDHPEFPELIVVQRGPFAMNPNLPHVTYLKGFISQSEVRALQNRCLFHLCPSTTEGFGHYLVEAMGCAAIVLATDGPPMNEHVTEKTGILIPYVTRSKAGLGEKFHVTSQAIAEKVSYALEMTEAERRQMQERAREHFEQNALSFKKNLERVVRENFQM